MQKGNKTPINKIGTPDWAKNGWRQFNPVSSISSIAKRPTLTVSNGKLRNKSMVEMERVVGDAVQREELRLRRIKEELDALERRRARIRDYEKHQEELYEENKKKLAEAEEEEEAEAKLKEQQDDEQDRIQKQINDRNFFNSTIGKIAKTKPETYLIARALWDLGQKIGLTSENSSDTGMRSTVGKIQHTSSNIEKAEAYKNRLNYQQTLNSRLADLKNLQLDLNGDHSKEINALSKEIININNKLLDKNLQELADAYELEQADKETGILERIPRAVSNLATQLTGSDADKKAWFNNNKNIVLKDYRQRHSNDSRSKRIQDANDFIAQQKEDQDGYINDYKDQARRRAYWNKIWGLTDATRKLAEIHDDDGLFSPGYWLYSMPKQYGSSVSSDAAIAGQAVSLGGMAAGGVLAALGHPEAGLGVYNVALLASTPYSMKGGFEENEGETADKWVENYRNNLSKNALFGSDMSNVYKDLQKQSIKFAMQSGSTAKEAKRLYNIDTEEGLNRVLQEELIGITKNNDPRLIKGKIGISKGLEQLRQADNMRTMGAEIAQTGLSLIKPGTSTKRLASEFLANAPERQLKRQLATTGVNKVLGKALNNKAGRFVIKAESKLGQLGERAAAKSDKYINSFESSQFGKGYAAGAAVSDMLGGGLAGDAILGVAGGAARKAAVTLKDAAPQALKDGILIFANTVKDKYTVLAAKIGATRAGKAAKKFLDSNAGEFTKLMAKYGVTTARKSLAERMSEGDEELAQYMNSKKDFANTYGYQSGDLVDLMTNDFKMIEPITKFYASYFGLANSELMNDAEAVSNWLGGFALGGMHPVAMAHFGHAVKDTYQQVSVRDAILNSTMFNREADKINRASDEVLVDQIARGRADQVMSQLSRLQKRDKNSKEPQFGDEFWDEKRQDVDRIQRLVKDKRINKMLEAIGITKGTKAYNVAIADQANLRKELDEVQTAQQEKKNDITQMYSSKEVNDEVDKIVDDIMNYKAAENATADAALKQDSKVEYLKDHELGEDATEEDKKKVQDDAEKYANAAVEQANQAKRENIRGNILGISHTVNKLKALIDLKARMNTADDIFNFYKEKFGISVFRPDAKRLLSNIDKQIQQAKYELQSFDKKYDAKSDDVATMTYLDDHVSDVIGFNSEEIQDAERHSAMLSANESILNGQIASLSNDLVLNDEGQYEFNPEEAKYNKKQQRLLMIKGEKYEPEKDHVRAEKKDASKNVYKKRIDAIIKANDDNAAINWMVSDIYSGDVVTKLYDDYFDEKAKEDAAIQKEIAKEFENQQPDMVNPSVVKDKTKLAENKRRYEENKLRAKEAYSRRKAKFRKSRRNRAYAMDPITALLSIASGPLFDVANNLIKSTQIGYYKFQNFWNDIKAIAEEEDKPSLLSAAKIYYINKFFNSCTEEKENMDLPLTVQLYKEDGVPAVRFNGTALGQTVRRILADKQRNTIISSYHVTIAKENGKLKPFYNQYALQTMINNHDKKRLLRETKKAIIEGNMTADQINEFYENNYFDKYFNENVTEEQFEGLVNQIFEDTKDEPNRRKELLEALCIYMTASSNYGMSEQAMYSIELGDAIRQMASAIFLGTFNKDDIRKYKGLNSTDNGINEAIEKIEKMRDAILERGFTILNTNVPIYGTKRNGQGISALADIVIMDNDGNIGLIDVLYSAFEDIERHMYEGHRSGDRRRGMLDREQKLLTSSKEVLYNMFGSNFIQAQVLPVHYNSDTHTIKVEDRFVVEPLDFDQTRLEAVTEDTDEAVDDMNTMLSEAVESFNNTIDALDSYGVQHQFQKQTVPVIHNEDKEVQSQVLLGYITDLNEQQRQASELLASVMNNVVEEVAGSPASTQIIEDDTEGLYTYLQDACLELDYQLSKLHDLPITNQNERDRLDAIYSAIICAQSRLDMFLSNPNQLNIDVTSEERLIASAVEKLINNRPYYGESAIAVSRWWATRLSKDLADNTTSNVSQFTPSLDYAYYQKIKYWLDAMSQHLLDELFDKPELQVWYKTLVNNYFVKLVDNAANRRLETDDQRFTNMYNAVIAQAREFIDRFNDTYDVDTDPAFDGSDVEKANRISVKWRDLYGATEKHTFSFYEMSHNGAYFSLSLQPDLIQNGTFEFMIRDGKLVMKIDNHGRATYIGFEDNEHECPPNMDVEYFERKRKANKRFVEKVKTLLELQKQNPNMKLHFTVTRDKGSIEYKANNYVNVAKSFIFNGPGNQHDLYTISFDKENRIGILKTTVDKTNGRIFYRVYGGRNLSTPIDAFDKQYVKQALQLQPGTIVYFYDNNFKEQEDHYIGTAISKVHIAPKIAESLVRLIRDYTAYNKTLTDDGYDIMSLLNMCLYIQKPNQVITPEQDTSSLVMLSPQTHSVRIGNDTYDMTLQDRKVALYQKLQTMFLACDEDFLNSNFNALAAGTNAALATAKNRFMTSSDDAITLPNGFVIQREDFLHQNDNGTIGTTALGYFLRNNLLCTTATKMRHTFINISDVTLVDESSMQDDDNADVQQIKDAQQVEKEEQKQVEDDPDDFLALFEMAVEDKETVNRVSPEISEFRKAVSDYLDSVLGEGSYTWHDAENAGASKFQKNAVVVGRCSEASIDLYNSAPNSVGFHEAFHKIFELMVNPKTRDEIYGLFTEYNTGEYTDREVAEELADMFVDYMQGSKYAMNGKIKRVFKRLGFLIGLFWKYRTKAIKFLNLYNSINSGKFKDTLITKEQSDRFKRLFGNELYYTIENSVSKEKAEFSYIANASDREEMAKALGCLILHSASADDADVDMETIKRINGYTPNKLKKALIKQYIGEGVDESELTPNQRAFREVFESVDETYKDKDGKEKTRKYYPKFAALSEAVANYISEIATSYDGKVYQDKEGQDDYDKQQQTDGEAVQNSNIDRYDKAAFEFNALESVTERVKYFFATIPYSKIDTETGHITIDTTRNKYGAPTYMDIREVYNIIVNDLHDVTNPQDLYNKLEARAADNVMYQRVFRKFKKIWDKMYTYNKEGNLVSIDYKAESFVIQIFSAIKKHRHEFIFGRSVRNKSLGGCSVIIRDSDYDRDAAAYPRLWQSFLVSGLSGLISNPIANRQGFLQLATLIKTRKGNMKNVSTAVKSNQFINIANLFKALETAAFDNANTVKINNTEFNLSSLADIERIKYLMIGALMQLGITVNEDVINHMLNTNYGGSGWQHMKEWLSTKTVDGKVTVSTFISALNNIVVADGIANKEYIDALYKTGFVSNLGHWLGAYDKIKTDQMCSGMDGTKLYNVSQNNSITNTVENLNSHDEQNPLIQTLTGYSYNRSSMNGFTIGSRLLRMIEDNTLPHMVVKTPIGFRTDSYGDTGAKYSELQEAEDYINKFAMLQNGFLVLPTLADKGTYMVIQFGQSVNQQKAASVIPGMQFQIGQRGGYVATNVPTIRFYKSADGKNVPYFMPSSAVIEQFIEYAKTEREAICECMEQLGDKYKDIPGYTRKGLPVVSEGAKIANYHKGKKGAEPQGVKFHSLQQLVVPKADGTVKTVTLVNNGKSAYENLKTANEEFFDKTPQEQAEIIALTLHQHTMLGVQKAKDLSIITTEDVSAIINNKQTVQHSATEEGIWNLQNINLDENQIRAVAEQFMKTPAFQQDIQAFPERTLYYNRLCRSLAIAAIIQDVETRSIICTEESLRCFIGNPAFFKGPEDIQKRIGGLVSTGDDNVTDLPGIKEEYTCAEMVNYETGSKSDIMKDLKTLMTEGEFREVYGNKFNDFENAFAKDKDGKYVISLDEIKKNLKELAGLSDKLIEKIEEHASAYADAYNDGIDVADGAAYITAQMCEDLLRMRGALLNRKIKKAFEILKEGKTDWLESRDAFDLIYHELNVVTTKYTAYGMRPHTLNGEGVSSLAIPYYNKFALFPLFDCISTGDMKNIYNKMKDEGVDMLLTESAVKIGLQGGVEYSDKTGTIDAPFNKYTQRFEYLRRQMNTDPEEGDLMTMGTQMLKVALSNLRLGREYRVFGKATNITGEQLLDELMDAINDLSSIGLEEFLQKFYDDAEMVDGKLVKGTLNQKKLSAWMIDQLKGKNTNQNVLKALAYNEATGEMECPIAATSDSTWMESILISQSNKDIIDITPPGSSFVQRSVFAIQSSKKADEEGVGLIQGAKKYNGQRLLMINEEGSMDALISIDFFQDLLSEAFPDGYSFAEGRAWLIENGIIGPKSSASTIGYRIPTQAQSSIHGLRFIDVVEAVLSTVILPEEFTKLTGSDFDIDHLYLTRKNFTIIDGKATLGGDNKLNLQNKIIDSMLTLLTDKESLNILYKSIDNDTALAEDVSKEIPTQGMTKDLAYNLGSLHELVTRKNDYITGKVGIGPFALNVTNHVLATLYDVRFRRTVFTETTGITGFNSIIDDDNNQISSWLSAFINAHVDIVKDPWISKLDVNQFSYNMINLLARNGKGKAGLWMLTQPIIRKLASITIASKSKFGRDIRLNKSASELVDSLIATAYQQLTGEVFKPEYVNDIVNTPGEDAATRRALIVNRVLKNIDMMKSISTKPDAKLTKEQQEFQKDVFLTWKILEKYANALGNLISFTKIDTRKQGKTFIQMMAYLNGYLDLYDDKSELFDKESLQRFLNSTWINQKTLNGIGAPISVMSGLTFNGTDKFNKYITGVLCKQFNPKPNQSFERDLSRNVLAMKTLSQAAISCIKVKYAFDYAEKCGVSVKGLFSPYAQYGSIYARLNSIKFAISRKDEAYSRLKNNYLLNHLAPVLRDANKDTLIVDGKTTSVPLFVSVLNGISESKMSSDMFIESWNDLLNDQDENIRNFARDLIIYALVSSGDYKGFNKLAKYIPFEWIIQAHGDLLSYSDYIREQLDNPTAIDDQLIALNLYSDGTIIGRDVIDNYHYASYDGNTTPQILIAKPGVYDEYERVPQYITIKSTGKSTDPTNYNLYKHAGFTKVKGTVVPVYTFTPKKGWHEAGGFDIYEYGDCQFAVNGLTVGFNPTQESIKLLIQYIEALDDESRDFNVNDILKQYLYGNLDYDTTSKNTPKNDYVFKTVSSGLPVIITSRYYTKEQPAEHPNNQYVFTDNAQCYCAAQGLDMTPFVVKNPRLTVTAGRRGTNQAVIRTDKDGNVYPNSFGIIVKKFSDLPNGGYARQEGCFVDTDEDFEYFKQLNEHMFNRLVTNKPIIFPAAIAKGKAALPLRFAEWLQQQLLERFDIRSNINVNTNPGYSGYGLDLVGFADTNNTTTSSLPGPETKINIYAGTGENADLSNFAKRPFDFRKGYQDKNSEAYKYFMDYHPFLPDTFDSVEQAFQAFKLAHALISTDYAGEYLGYDTDERKDSESYKYGEKISDQLSKIIDAKTSAEAKRLGGQRGILSNEDISWWDNHSSEIMKFLLKQSFRQNPQALQRLLATGNATLTHTQDNGKWGTEFPKLLMEVRDELRKENPQIQNNSNNQDIVIQLIDQLKASGINVLGKADMEKYLTENGKLDPVLNLQAIKENKEMQDIKAKALADGTFMKAPNGKPTNLTERQWLQVRTKAFKEWFGDWENDPANASKVVDENGEPKVMYHGTPWGEFNVFKQFQPNTGDRTKAGELYFGNSKDMVRRYTRGEFNRGNNSPKVYEVFLNIRNPYKNAELINKEQLDEILEDLKSYLLPNEFDEIKQKVEDNWKYSKDRFHSYYVYNALASFFKTNNQDRFHEVVRQLRNSGHKDGMFFLTKEEWEGDPINFREGIKKQVWVMDPNQIKSATDNIGTFSTENDDIQMFIGKKARTQFEYRLRKARPDMSDAEIKSTLDFLHSLEDNKENTAYIKAAIRWITNRSLTLPQDHTKAHQVFEIARKKHIDLQKYNTLGELIASPEMQPKEKEKVKFNPDEAKTFSNKRTVTTKGGRVFTVYDVENTEEGQREVCKALAAHYKASPWCLSTFTSKGEPTESAKKHWNHYDSIPRKIAYENGKPVAFSSAHNMAKFTFRGMPVANNSKRFWFESIGDPMFVTNEEINISQLQTSELLEQYKKDGLVKYDGTGNKYVWQNYSLTEKAIKELKEVEKDAWWDMEDSYPQDFLSDSIISDPNSVGSLRNVAGIVAEYLGLLGTPDEIDTLVEMQQQNIPLTEANYRSFVRGQREFIPIPVNPFPEEEMYDLPDDLPFFITPNGEVYGFVDKEGNIYLDETVISPEHPIHEYTHLWDRALAKNNPKLWKKGVKLMQEGASSLWNDIANSETYGKLWQSKGISGDKLTNLIASEVHARLVGVNGAKLLDQLAEEKGKANIIAKLKLWILDAWKELKATFSNWSQEEIDKLTLKDFNHMTVRDFADGINPNNTTVLSNESTLTTKQALDRANGFIGEVNRSPYTKYGGEFVLKNDTPVLNALKVVMDRGHKPEKSSFGDEYDGQVSYNLGYSSGSKTVMAVTNRDLFDEGWEATDILLMRESERYGQPLESQTEINIESNKQATFLVDENDKVLIEHLKEKGYKYELYTDNPTAASNVSNTSNKDLSSYELYSGAADGSDKEWGAQARALGIKVKDYVVQSYRDLTQEWKNRIEKEYVEARAFLGKPILTGYRGELTRRDMMQADKADAIFAIAERIVKPGEQELSNGKAYTNNTNHDNVQGGTSNAVARGIIRGIPVYVFDQSDNTWKVWNNSSKSFVSTSEPTLTPHAAVIGTRGINEYGKAAIKSVLLKLTNNNEQQNRDILKESMSSKEHENC